MLSVLCTARTLSPLKVCFGVKQKSKCGLKCFLPLLNWGPSRSSFQRARIQFEICVNCVQLHGVNCKLLNINYNNFMLCFGSASASLYADPDPRFCFRDSGFDIKSNKFLFFFFFFSSFFSAKDIILITTFLVI